MTSSGVWATWSVECSSLSSYCSQNSACSAVVTVTYDNEGYDTVSKTKPCGQNRPFFRRQVRVSLFSQLTHLLVAVTFKLNG